MLITLAPWSAAQVMPLATQDWYPAAWSLSTLTFSRRELYPTPATPFLLFVTAAAIPATWVPWP